MTVLKSSIRIPVISRPQEVIITPKYGRVNESGVLGVPVSVIKPMLISISIGLAGLAGAYMPQLIYQAEQILSFGF